MSLAPVLREIINNPSYFSLKENLALVEKTLETKIYEAISKVCLFTLPLGCVLSPLSHWVREAGDQGWSREEEMLSPQKIAPPL